MENYKIKINSVVHSKQVQEAFFKLGYTWDNKSKYSYMDKLYLFAHIYGGLTYGNLNCTFQENSNKEITLEELQELVQIKTLKKKPFPKKMFVSDTNRENLFEKRTVLAYIEGQEYPYIVKDGNPTNDDTYVGYKYAKHISEKVEVHLTIKDISEGKGVGVDPNLIRIKE